MDTYNGTVYYSDGWHWSVDTEGNLDEKLFLEEDGTYRLATDEDQSWHERHHKQYVTAEFN